MNGYFLGLKKGQNQIQSQITVFLRFLIDAMLIVILMVFLIIIKWYFKFHFNIIYSELILFMNKDQSPDFQSMKKHVLTYSVANNTKASLAIALSFFFEAVSILLFRMEYNTIACIFRGFVLIRMFVQLHDMAHFSFFSNITVNRIVGKFFGIYTHYPFNAWRDGHNHHHKHFGNLDRSDVSQTILFTKKEWESMKGIKKIVVRILRQPIVFFLVSVPFLWFIGLIFVVAKRYGVFSWSFLQKMLSFVSVFAIFPLLGVPVIYSWISLWFATVIGATLFHLQHSVNTPYRRRGEKWNFAEAALEGSTYLKIPIILQSFTNGIEYHHIHHLNTNVPSYQIRNCHFAFDELEDKQNHWDIFHINRVDLLLALESMKNVMLDEENGTLLPFP